MRLFSTTFFLITLLLVCVSQLQSQWVRSGPYGGQQKHLASGNGIVLTGCDDGMYRSTDDGATWESANNGLTARYIDALLSTGTDFYLACDARIYRSTDGGQNWLGLGPVNPSFPYVISFAATATSLFAGTMTNGVYRSTDRGSSWISVNSGLPASFSLQSLAAMGTELYIATWSDSVWRSTDDGASWQPASGGIYSYSIHCLTVSGSVLFGAGDGSGVYRSTDHGASWQLSPDLAGISIAVLSAQGSTVLAGADVGIFRSTDLGANWALVDSTRGINDIALAGTLAFAAADEGILRSTNTGAAWSESNEGITDLYLTLSSIGGTILAGGIQHGAVNSGVFRSTDDGATWRDASQGIRDSYGNMPSITAFASLGGNVYCSAQMQGVFRSSDNGASWNPASAGLLDQYGYGQINALASSGSNLYAGGLHGVFISSDQGSTWNRYNEGLADTNVSALSVCGTHLFASAWSGAFLRNDGDAHWTTLSMPSYGMPVIGSSGSTIVAGYPGGTIYRSTDYGSSWIPIDGSDGCTVVIAVPSPSGAGHVALGGTYSGVYRSTDDGVSFSDVNEGWDSPEVTSLAATNDYLFAATSGEGVWKQPLKSATSVSSSGGDIPKGFALFQNYPNPFNPKTLVSGQWTADGWVRLAVYDLLGREITVLANGRYPAGKYTFTFDGTNLASGVYLCRLAAGAHSAVTKMILIR